MRDYEHTKLSDLSDIVATELVNGGVFHCWARNDGYTLHLEMQAEEGLGRSYSARVYPNDDIRRKPTPDIVEELLADYSIGTTWGWDERSRGWYLGQFAHEKNWKVKNYDRS